MSLEELTITVGLLVWGLALWLFLSAGSHFLKMRPHVANKRRALAQNLLPFILALTPSSYDAEGKRHLKSFYKYFAAFGVVVLVIIGVFIALDIPTGQ
jgi:hypothetical protein